MATMKRGASVSAYGIVVMSSQGGLITTNAWAARGVHHLTGRHNHEVEALATDWARGSKERHGPTGYNPWPGCGICAATD
jgi:hypothetical protein